MTALNQDMLGANRVNDVRDLGFVFTGNYERARTYGVDLSFEF